MTHAIAAEDTVRAIIAATDAADVDRLSELVTDDVRLRFASDEPSIGKDRMLSGAEEFFASIASISHDIGALWSVAPDTVIAEMTVHYQRLDGRRLSLPCTDIFYLRDGLIADYRVYMDIAPVFA
jgi:ketosteroid isomerase-like protein